MSETDREFLERTDKWGFRTDEEEEGEDFRRLLALARRAEEAERLVESVQAEAERTVDEGCAQAKERERGDLELMRAALGVVPSCKCGCCLDCKVRARLRARVDGGEG